MRSDHSPARTVASILTDLIAKHSRNGELLNEIIDRERLYISDTSRVSLEQIEQLVLSHLKKVEADH